MGKVWDKTRSSDQTPLRLTDVRQLELVLEGADLGSHTRPMVAMARVSITSLVTSPMSPVCLVVVTIPVCAAWARA